ncbi:MAG: DUF6760 family protein [Cyanobacteria bacterium P01_E01_bin.6]
MIGYPLDNLYEEVAMLSMTTNWSLDDIINLEHGDRQRWLQEVMRLRESR